MQPTGLTAGKMDNDLASRAILDGLFREHFDSVFAFCLVRCGSRPLAEEIASDVFADAVRTVVSDDQVELNKSWLFTVAKRRLIDHWRRAERERLRIGRLMQTTRPLSDEIVGNELLDDERVLTALASLPDRQRAVLALRYLDDMSVGEVAEALDTSYQATESLLARARRSFARGYDRTVKQ